MVVDHMPLIHYIAVLAHQSMPTNFHTPYTIDDLTQFGAILAFRSARRYVDGSEAKFSSYLVPRLRWGFFDLMNPQRRRKDQAHLIVIPIDGVKNGSGEFMEPDELEFLAKDYDDYDEVELQIDYEKFLETVSTRERFILEELAKGTFLEEIGDMVGVTEGRISQIRQKLRWGYEFSKCGS